MKHIERERASEDGGEHMDDAEYEAAQEVVHKLEVIIQELGFVESSEMRAISSSICPSTEDEARPIVQRWYEMGETLLGAAGSVDSLDYRKASLGLQLALAALYHWWGVGEESVKVFDECLLVVEQDADLCYLLDNLHELL